MTDYSEADYQEVMEQALTTMDALLDDIQKGETDGLI